MFKLNELLNTILYLKAAFLSCLMVVITDSVTATPSICDSLLLEIRALADSDDFEKIIDFPADANYSYAISKCSCDKKGRISHLIGTANYFLNREHEAITHFKNAAYECWKDCDDISMGEVANTLYNIGVSYQYTENILQGKSYIDSALLMIEDIQDYPKEELTYKYQGAGSYFSNIGDYGRAEAYLNNAMQLSEHVDQVDAFYIHIDLLALLLRFKKNNQANNLIDVIDRKFINEVNILYDEDLAFYYLNCAEAFLNQGNYNRADSFCNQAVQLLPPSDPNLLSNAYEILGVINYRQENYESSKKYYNLAYELRLQEEDIVGANIAMSFALENLAEIDLTNQNFTSSLDKVNQAIYNINPAFPRDRHGNPVLRSFEVDNAFHLVRQLMLKEKIMYEKYETTKDVDLLNNCLNLHYKVDTLIDNVLSNAFMDQSKLELLDNMSNHSSRAIDVCLELYKQHKKRSYLDIAFYFSSRSKAIVLQKLVDNNDFLTNKSNTQIISEYTQLKDALNNVQKAIHQSSNNEDSLMNEFASIQLKFDKFYDRKIFQNRRNKLHYRKEMSSEDIQSRLNSDQVLIDIFHGEKMTTLFVLSKDDMEIVQIKNQAFIPKVNRIKELCLLPDKIYNIDLAHQVFSELFSWVSGSNLRELKSIFIIPDGSFHGLPFEVLIDQDGNFLIENYDIAYGYEASMLFDVNKKSENEYDFAGWATSYSKNLSERLRQQGFSSAQSNIGNLDFAMEELKACDVGFKGKTFYGEKANVANFRKVAFDSRIVYLSMHGIVDRENGANSSLIFDDGSENFVFRAYELYRQPMNTDMVILSACNTADGKFHSGEGINGISRAFLASGVNSIISSIWAASEGSSMKLLPAFLEKYESGLTKAKALQHAKKDYLAKAIPSQKHPFYWANYILISSIEEKSSMKGNSMYYLFILVVIVLIFLLLRKYLYKPFPSNKEVI